MGFFEMTVPMLLVEKGVHFSDLGLLSIMSYPYAIKFLAAPFLDAVKFTCFNLIILF